MTPGGEILRFILTCCVIEFILFPALLMLVNYISELCSRPDNCAVNTSVAKSKGLRR